LAASPLPEPPEGWQADARCLGAPTDVFFPTAGESLGDALAVCSTCPVLAACAVAGLSERFGVFGGLSEQGRSKVRRSLGLSRTPHYRPPLSSPPPPPYRPPRPRPRSTTAPPAELAPTPAEAQDARIRRRGAEAAIGE
jgi:hypothetical protein